MPVLALGKRHDPRQGGETSKENKNTGETFWHAVKCSYVSKISFPIHAVNIGGNSVLDLQPAAYNSV